MRHVRIFTVLFLALWWVPSTGHCLLAATFPKVFGPCCECDRPPQDDGKAPSPDDTMQPVRDAGIWHQFSRGRLLLDKAVASRLLDSPLSFLRSKFFLAIVSLFVLTGYCVELFGDCCSHREQGQTEHGKSAPNDQTPGDGDGCQCVCHQIIDPLTPGPTRVADGIFASSDFVAHADEFPPDAVPLGIDHPPQIA